MTLQPNLYPILTRRAPSTQTHQPLHVDTQLLAHLSHSSSPLRPKRPDQARSADPTRRAKHKRAGWRRLDMTTCQLGPQAADAGNE